jgi:hypothetical protein
MMTKMIKPEDYILHKEGGFKYVTMKMIESAHTPEKFENFIKWIAHQTVGVTPDGESAIYVWEYERWVRQGHMTEQCSHDWD